MTGAEALAILNRAEELLAAQHAELAVAEDFTAAEILANEVSQLLTGIANAGELDHLDNDLRVRLQQAVQRTNEQLSAAHATLLRMRGERLEEQARAERDNAAVRRYLPPGDQQTAHYLDERR
jgi:hypothetical protein